MSAPAAALSLRPEGLSPRPLAELAEVLPKARWTGPPPAGVHITGVALDSRSVRPGDLYAAVPGSRVHGADFSGAARAAGAVAVLTDDAGRERAGATGLPIAVVEAPRDLLGLVAGWVYWWPAEHLRVLGVTGTNGKTTTAYLMEAGLRAAGHSTGMIGTVGTRVAGEALQTARTTPEAPDVQALLAVMRQRGVDSVAMEVSSHALALGRVDGLRYDVAVFTNLSQDHLDFHADLEAYFAVKASLFEPARAATAVVNADDPYGVRLLGRTPLPATSYSAAGNPAADWRAGELRPAAGGTRFEVYGPGGIGGSATVALPGRFNVDNALAAVAALATAGEPLDAVLAGVASLPGVPGRMERVDAGQPFLALVDYAHTPEAVANLLAALRPVTSGRVIAVLGCGGDRDRAKRAPMGAAAVRGADLAVLTSDNPRSEDPLAILVAMAAGVREVPAADRATVILEPDRAAAIGLAVERAGPGDTVVVAGKGHEQGQEVAGRTVAFDDRSVLLAALVQAGSVA